MAEDFSELIEYLDKKFQKIDKQFESLPGIFVTKEDLDEKTDYLTTKDDFNKLLSAVDAYANRADTYFQEMLMLGHKVDRHEKWIQQIAEKLDIKLLY